MPSDTDTMPIALPYPAGTLNTVKLGETDIPFRQTGKGRYELDLPMDDLADRQTTIEAVWSLPLDALKKDADKGYWTVLKTLIPSISYKLTVILDPGSGFELTIAPFKDRYVPFRVNGQLSSHFGSCRISIRPSDQR